MNMDDYTGLPSAPRLVQQREQSMEMSTEAVEASRVAQRELLEAADAMQNDMLGMASSCRWCGRIHPLMYCPSIRAIKWNDDGQVVELHADPRPESMEGLIFDTRDDMIAALREAIDNNEERENGDE